MKELSSGVFLEVVYGRDSSISNPECVFKSGYSLVIYSVLENPLTVFHTLWTGVLGEGEEA